MPENLNSVENTAIPDVDDKYLKFFWKLIEISLIIPLKTLKYFFHLVQLTMNGHNVSNPSSLKPQISHPNADFKTSTEEPENADTIPPPSPSPPPPLSTTDREKSIEIINDYVRTNPGAFIARSLITKNWKFRRPKSSKKSTTKKSRSPLKKAESIHGVN